MTRDIVEGDIYTNYSNRGYCSHGIVVAVNTPGGLVMQDTYWYQLGLRYHSDCGRHYPPSAMECEDWTFIGNLKDLKKVDRRAFAPYERGLFIPRGGGREQHWVFTADEPSRALIVEQLELEIADIEGRIRSLARDLKEKKAELKEVET